MEILQNSHPQIHQLARLTEALRGGYTLNSNEEGHDEYTEWIRHQNEKEEEQTKRDERIIRQQLREYGREMNPHLALNWGLERMHDEHMTKPKIGEGGGDAAASATSSSAVAASTITKRSTEGVVKVSTASSSKKRKTGHTKKDRAKARKRKSGTYIAAVKWQQSIGSTTTNSSVSVTQGYLRSTTAWNDKAAKEAVLHPATAVALNVATATNADAVGGVCVKETIADEKPPARKDSPETRRASACDPPPAAIAAAPTTQQPVQAPSNTATKSLTPRPYKKCHHCRDTNAEYRKCNYWNLSGSKCGKVFCITCLSSKYTLGDDVAHPSNPNGVTLEEILDRPSLDREWHCPSCLGPCQCKTCVRQRQREEEKVKSREEAERKSSRKAAAHQSYYNFL